LQCGHRCFRQRWRARIFIFILRRSDRAHHLSPSAAVAARNSSTVSVQAAPIRADRIGKTVRPVQRPEASGSPPLQSSPQILDSRASTFPCLPLRPARQSGGSLCQLFRAIECNCNRFSQFNGQCRRGHERNERGIVGISDQHRKNRLGGGARRDARFGSGVASGKR